jgi:hypothetical protein
MTSRLADGLYEQVRREPMETAFRFKRLVRALAPNHGGRADSAPGL